MKYVGYRLLIIKITTVRINSKLNLAIFKVIIVNSKVDRVPEGVTVRVIDKLVQDTICSFVPFGLVSRSYTDRKIKVA